MSWPLRPRIWILATNARAELTLGLFALDQGDYPEALRALEAGLALDRNNTLFYLSLANAFVMMGVPQKALPLAEKALRRDPLEPGRSGAMYFAGLASFFLGESDRAIDRFEQARSANPNQPRTYAGLAVAYAARGYEEKARENTAALRRLAPNFRMSTSVEHPLPSSPETYRQQYEKLYLTAARKAGLPD